MAAINEVRHEAMSAMAEGALPWALSLARLILHHFPRDYATLGLMGQTLLDSGRYGEAHAALERALEIDPENIQARLALATLAEKEGDLQTALDQLECAFDINGSNYRLVREIGRVHAQLGSTWPLDPGSSRYARANRLVSEKKYREAIPLFKESLRVAPRPEIAVGMAHALWLAGNVREAEVAAKEAINEWPNCLKALAILAGASATRGEESPLLAQTSELDPGNGVARGIFAAVRVPFPATNERTEIPDEELRELKARLGTGHQAMAGQHPPPAVAKGPEGTAVEVSTRASDASLHASFGRFYEARGQIDLALAEYKTALRLDSSVASEVASAAQAIADGDPARPEARWLAGDALAAQGRLRGAMEQYLLALRYARNRELAAGETIENDKD